VRQDFQRRESPTSWSSATSTGPHRLLRRRSRAMVHVVLHDASTRAGCPSSLEELAGAAEAARGPSAWRSTAATPSSRPEGPIFLIDINSWPSSRRSAARPPSRSRGVCAPVCASASPRGSSHDDGRRHREISGPAAGPRSRGLFAEEQEYIGPRLQSIALYSELAMESGSGSTLRRRRPRVPGLRRGIGVASIGYAHPDYVRALERPVASSASAPSHGAPPLLRQEPRRGHPEGSARPTLLLRRRRRRAALRLARAVEEIRSIELLGRLPRQDRRRAGLWATASRTSSGR